MNGGNVRRVVGVQIHPQYVSYRGQYDVAVLKLAEPIVFNMYEKSIALPNANAPKFEEVTIIAWGVTAFSNGIIYPNLQQLRVISLNNEQCNTYYQSRVISDGEFCTFLRPGSGVCTGDSGSPVVYKGILVGVVSSAVPCAVGLPDVHTNIFTVRDFIVKAITS